MEDGTTDPYTAVVRAAAAWKSFDKALSKLGLPPVDRSKLHVPATKADEKGKGRFFKVVG